MLRVALYAPLIMQVKIQKPFDQMQAPQIYLEKSGIAFCLGMVGHSCEYFKEKIYEGKAEFGMEHITFFCQNEVL
jgi:hypothetical protein